MKKILCLVIIVMMLLTCVGCTEMETVQETQQQTSNKSMFVLIESNVLLE